MWIIYIIGSIATYLFCRWLAKKDDEWDLESLLITIPLALVSWLGFTVALWFYLQETSWSSNFWKKWNKIKLTKLPKWL